MASQHYWTKGPDSNGGEPRDGQLDDIRREVARISAMLDAITYNFRLAPPRSPPQMPVSFDAGRAALAKSLYRERRIRDELLPCDLFAEPAWDMLLDLYGAHYRRAEVSVSSLCIAACVPGTTALRWIKTMEDAGLFKRQCDPIDKRRIFIWLSEGARLAMDAYFDKLAQVRGQA